MIVEDLHFPKYKGNETQYEHIFYTYLDLILATRGYVSKIKKTGFPNIDENILSNSSQGSCDSYILSNNNEDSLFALVELESTGYLKKGLTQVQNYADKLSIAFKKKKYFTKHEKVYLIVYDGQQIWISEYNLKKQENKIILGDENTGVEITEKEKSFLINLFQKKEIINSEEDEKSLIKNIKNILRANKQLQGNKAFILTVLASIYGNTQKKSFSDSIKYLETQSKTNVETNEIYDKWKKIKSKIEYDNSLDIQEKIKELYENVSIKLYILAQDKKLDLYGYIYEELAEKSNKKEDGEYYTPRTHIRPVVNSVYEKYLKNIWDIPKNTDSAIEKLKTKNVIDIFCGSGGFLYEYLKILKQKYSLNENQINDIAFESVSGFDKNDITAAYFNLFLVGDGRSKLKQVTTSINWQNFWKNELVESKNSKIKKAKKIENQDKLIKSIESNIETFTAFLFNLVNIEYVKQNFSLSDDYIKSKNIIELLDTYILKNGLRLDSYFHRLANKNNSYIDEKEPILKLIFDTLVEISSDKEPINYKDFLENLGNIDFLMTNVPYGDIDDQRIKGDYSSKLESQALKECIDLLRPSSYKINNTTGKKQSNEDGGIATIVIPNGLLERDEFELKEYLLKRCDILSIVKLPFYTFSPYALIQTYFLTIRKKAPFEFNKYEQKHEVFMYIVNNDGKANSDKRFETKLISSERNIIKDSENNNKTFVYEYIHDELSINLEEYSEGYFSKLERSWIYGNLDSVNSNWNQQRLTEKWTGTTWETLEGKKWDFKKLEIKTFKKQVECKNNKIESLIKNAIINDDSFESLEIDNKKEYLIKEIKKLYLADIRFAKLDTANESVILYSQEKSKKTIQNLELKSFIYDKYKSLLNEDTIKNIEIYHNEIIDEYDGNLNNDMNQLLEFLNLIDDIIIFENGEEIKLIQNKAYELYDLNIHNYLDIQKYINFEEIYESLIRLYTLQNKMNYSVLKAKECIKNAIDDISSLSNSNIVPLHTMISSFKERGKRITLEDIYNNYGLYPVYSSTITGNIGYYKEYNEEISSSSLLYAIEGNAGSISIPVSESNKIWLLDVAGIINIKDEYLAKYSREAISIYLEYLFKNNRHNNSGQPKFLLKKNLDLEIDLNIIEIFNNYINMINE